MTQIRFARLSDEPQLFELVRAFPTPTPINMQTYAAMFRQKLQDPDSCIAVAAVGPELVGYVSGHRHRAFYAAGESAWVDEILVAEALRRQGVGRKLMAAFEAWALEAGCRLSSLATAGAVEFYASLGYSTRAGYFKKYLGPSVAQ